MAAERGRAVGGSTRARSIAVSCEAEAEDDSYPRPSKPNAFPTGKNRGCFHIG